MLPLNLASRSYFFVAPIFVRHASRNHGQHPTSESPSLDVPIGAVSNRFACRTPAVADQPEAKGFDRSIFMGCLAGPRKPRGCCCCGASRWLPVLPRTSATLLMFRITSRRP